MNQFFKYLLLISILLMSCHKREKQVNFTTPHKNDTIIINGNFKASKTRDAIYLGSRDEFANHNEFSLDLKNSPYFTYKLISKSPIILRDDDALGQVNYVLTSGDDVNITENDSTKLLVFRVKNSLIRNNELNFFCDFKNHRNNMPYFKLIKDIVYKGPPNQDYKEYYVPYRYNDLDFVKKYTIIKFNDENDFLNNYTRSNKISLKLKTCFEDMFYFEYMRTRIRIAIELTKSKKETGFEFDNDIKSFKEKTQHNNYLYIPDCEIALEQLAEYYKLKSRNNNSLYDLIKQNFSGVNKDYLLFIQMKNSLSTQHIDTILLNNFYKDCYSPDFRNEIKRNVNLIGPSKNTTLISDGGINTSFEDLKAHYHGQVLYIDFWASWCVPCLRQMPNAKILHNDLKNQPVHFIYCSLDNSVSAWEVKNRQLDLDKKNSFIVKNGFKSDLAKNFNITTIPRYIIIGKDGKVYSLKGYLPDNRETKAYLLKLCSDKKN